MDATIPRTNQTAKKIVNAYAHLYHFCEGDDFYWSSSLRTVYYKSLATAKDTWKLIHEIGHAELTHTLYTSDIQLIQHEAAAWDYACTTIAPIFKINVPEEFVQECLDTYRQWLHVRSTCPSCGQTGVQTQNTYSCINCRCLWQANEARLCNVRRKKITQQVQNRPETAQL